VSKFKRSPPHQSLLSVVFFPATPNAPGKPEVDDVDEDSVTISWQKPKDDGGDKVTGYQVEMKEEGSSKWKPVNDFAIRDTFYTGINKTQTSICQMISVIFR
jgi:hypothetical protein